MTDDFMKMPNSLDEYWMPFTPQRLFKQAPRIVARADGMYYYDEQGREILDGTAGLWCVNLGHNHPHIKEKMKAQLDALDFSHSFQLGHPSAFVAAKRLVDAMPDGIDHVFFSNSGSEAVDTALKIALGYWHAQGKAQRRVLIGRERGYHGVGFGGISVGGLSYNRKAFGPALLGNCDHIAHTHDLEHNAFTRGSPEWGAHFADDLERRLTWVHDPETVAAVIIEPVAGSTGVLPPPKGYLKRIREICDKHGILLIFDEVITAFGRFGHASSAEYYGVMPDMITSAKGLTNGMAPMGATFVSDKIYQAFMQGPTVFTEFMHGYTYSGHPLACAAAIGTLDVIEQENVYAHAAKMMQPLEDAVHSLRGLPHVIDIRNAGLLGAVEFEKGPPDDPYKYPRHVMIEAFKQGVMVRFTGNTMAISPPVIVEQKHLDRIIDVVAGVMRGM
jgi:beta-alanine--pyruvate transaminase